jgi:hypothetical protein
VAETGLQRYIQERNVPDDVPLDQLKKTVLRMRRQGCGYDQIAEELGFKDRFAVIDILNQIYKEVRSPNLDEIRDTAETQIDDLINVYQEAALGGDLKTAKFLLEAIKLKMQIRGGIQPPQVTVNIDNRKPWEKVYGTVLSDPSEISNVVEAQVQGDDGEWLS